MKYLNMKTSHGVETLDKLNPKDFPSYKEFKQECRRLFYEYVLSGHSSIYWSNRPCKKWNK